MAGTAQLAVLVVILFLAQLRAAESRSRCEPITIPLCQNIQYNEAVFPNLLNHTDQQEAGQEVHQFFPLVKINCSLYLQRFLCSVYAPNCTVHRTPIPPCRSLCLEVQNGCLKSMERFGFSWPGQLRCDQYPLFVTGTQCWKGEVENRSLSEPQPGVNTGCSHKGKEYKVGESRKDDEDCNTCTCMEGGVWACTEMFCPKECLHNDQKYKVGESRKDDCNTCICGNRGLWKCTKMACPGSSAVCIHNGKKYKQGQTRKDDCNTCFCAPRGMWACTVMFCPPKGKGCYHKGKFYKENEQRMDDCNTCYCGSTGHWGCTLMACPPKLPTGVPPPPEDTKCQKHYRRTTNKTGMPVTGVFIPKCKDDGSYAEVQCHPSTGFCWCSTKDGDKIPGTSKRGKAYCDEASLTKCQNHYKRAMTRKRSPMVGVFVPRCADDGSYARTQCHGSTGFCWCADKDGKKFPETSIRGKPDCKGCPHGAKWYKAGESRNDGCNTCSCASTGQWRCTLIACPQRSSQPIPAIGVPPPPEDTKCQKHYRSALEKSGLPVIGVFIPKCTENGSYAEVQCHPSTGYCWCSTKDGDKIPGTSKRGKRDCDEASLTKCQNHYQKAMTKTRLRMVGVFIPSCDNDGSYARKQCHGSTGYCWCADKHGKKFQETSVRGEPDCKGCPHGNKWYKAGESRSDGCNTCWCGSTGHWGCTLKFCPSVVPDVVPSTEKGKKRCREACPRIYDPQCGTNGVTYANECLLKNATCHSDGKIKIAYEGKCQDKSPDGCSIVECRIFCFAGYEYDKNGCKLCKCRPRAPQPKDAGAPGSS